MNTNEWLQSYFDRYSTALFKSDVRPQIRAFRGLATEVQRNDAKLLFAGNGASAAIASHVSVDFTKQGGIRAMNFNEADLITCFSNDFGYEHWIAKAVEFYAKPKDAVVLISCSGRSPNVVKAAETARVKGLTVVTFTGFAEDNPLKTRGQINFWVDSRVYNIIECVHMIWLTTVIDLIIGKAEYGVS
jgi:D-sedoheptulose 7-phosphate isomerase